MALDSRGSNETAMPLERRVTVLTNNNLGYGTAITIINVHADTDYHASHIEKSVNIRPQPISRETERP
jgi:hypothetical protein